MSGRRGYRAWSTVRAAAVVGSVAVCGCQWFIDDADREVYRLLDRRQMDALGEKHDARLAREKGPWKTGSDAYEFVPHPIDSGIPEAFTRAAPKAAHDDGEAEDEGAADSGAEASATQPPPATQPATTAPNDPLADREAFRQALLEATGLRDTAGAAAEPIELGLEIPDITRARATTQPAPGARMFTLSGALKQGLETGRTYQSAKETLYLAILDLTLERHFWTPRLFGDVEARFADFGQVRNFDRAMEAVSTVGVEQNLPYGGQVTAQLVNTLARDLGRHVTSGESGSILVQADIPLLRGAGRVAYESRYRAEREVVYAVRAFERFRREFLVDVAATYFRLLSAKQQLVNGYEAVVGTERTTRRTVARAQLELDRPIDAQQSIVDLLRGLISQEQSKTNYDLQKDQFKILLGLDTEVMIDVPAQQELEDELNASLIVPGVSIAEAVETGLKYRLELITVLDQIGDAERGVAIAQNGLLPDLNLRGSVQTGTDPDHLNSADFNTERTMWQGTIQLELPLDRKAERNAYRRSQIFVRRAERNHSLARDQVRRDVRDAKRRLDLALFQLDSETASARLSEEQLRATVFQYENPPPIARGGLRQIDIDVLLDAEDRARRAKDNLARAQSDVWTRILELFLATGTLRVDDDGHWVELTKAPE